MNDVDQSGYAGALGAEGTLHIKRAEPQGLEVSIHREEPSVWTCYLFGGDRNWGMCYTPRKGCEPNIFVRWMMKICFGCRWVRVGEKNE